jgi:hypothetical protein
MGIGWLRAALRHILDSTNDETKQMKQRRDP